MEKRDENKHENQMSWKDIKYYLVKGGKMEAGKFYGEEMKWE